VTSHCPREHPGESSICFNWKYIKETTCNAN
jgi:hypothetical protein